MSIKCSLEKDDAYDTVWFRNELALKLALKKK